MPHLIRHGIAVLATSCGLLVLAGAGAQAAGPQELPAAACNTGVATASSHAPTRTSAEAIPHVEHSYPIPVPYCHHFNPTASPPPAP
ncbi:hypothetical protein OO014_10005 [Intrasporangium calvum]|uniref:Secreted protein n=1 Tax=Intrasporangium calvum TaxID=53358 RepID=A0ABT5GIT4_9MICO|nr:hypothetical protein [Intrasporangium calvum]MDC5697591.1 hypothetical protein [Intrasporangium calvum]